MRFSTVVIATGVLSSSLASAATCWLAATCPNYHFETRSTLATLATSYCDDNWNKSGGRDFAGDASASHTLGAFLSQGSCVNAFNDIIASCLGKKNGGVTTSGNARLTLAFGNCELL
ncbi:hypothetical protein H0H92_011414 [Tricholoma furcatifolium]|nr:hypothetical protein H0H92_011414 [Tricholoma furcatifolium]